MLCKQIQVLHVMATACESKVQQLALTTWTFQVDFCAELLPTTFKLLDFHESSGLVCALATVNCNQWCQITN